MAEMFVRLKKQAVTAVTTVTAVTGYETMPLKLRSLRQLRANDAKEAKGNLPAVTAPPEPDEDAIFERAGMAEDGVPTIYLDAWSRLNHHKPARVSESEWRQALDDGGRFLDEWGELAARLGWTADDLFSYPAGLVWWLCDDTVSALAPEVARSPNGRMMARPSQPT